MEHMQFSEASDVYSFGMITWELFTRQIPFPNMNPHQAALAVINEDKRPDIPAFVPPNFVKLIQDCWHRDPKKRPAFPAILERLKKLKEEGLPRLELSLDNARLYQKKTAVFAFKSKDAVIVYKNWGTGEGKKGDWVIVGPNDDVYTCDAKIFQKTYTRVDEKKPHMFKKTGKVLALQMDHDFLMKTLEGMEHGKKGDFLAQNPIDGEQWPIARDKFEAMYEISAVQSMEEIKLLNDNNRGRMRNDEVDHGLMPPVVLRKISDVKDEKGLITPEATPRDANPDQKDARYDLLYDG
jgi:serine/threonine protein kinase